MISTGTQKRLRDLTKVAQTEVAKQGPIFCTDCGVAANGRRSVCENCGSSAIPCDAKEQVVIALNAHELRLLCHHAEKWCRAHSAGAGTLYSIMSRIRTQLPVSSMLPTIESDIEDESNHLRGSHGD